MVPCRFHLIGNSALLILWLTDLRGAMPLMLSQWLITLMNDFIGLVVRYSLYILVIIAVDSHCTVDMLFPVSRKAWPSALFDEGPLLTWLLTFKTKTIIGDYPFRNADTYGSSSVTTIRTLSIALAQLPTATQALN